MNVESTNSAITNIKQDSTTQSTSSNPTKDTKTSFKDELNAAKPHDKDKKVNQNDEKDENLDNTQAKQLAEQTVQTQKLAGEISVQQNLTNKQNSSNNNNNSKGDDLYQKSLDELSSKIATINDITNPSVNSKTQKTTIGSTDKTSDSSNYCKSIKMDNNDINFYVNLVNNQNMTAQNIQAGNNPDLINNSFSDIKNEATQKTVQVSSTLMDAINESAKTNKPFRIDFDSDVAVIMKVDKNGVLSANFIPGNAAVENYLRNNIESLKQSFNEQNLQYNELSYSSREKQQQQERRENQSKNKENQNE